MLRTWATAAAVAGLMLFPSHAQGETRCQLSEESFVRDLAQSDMLGNLWECLDVIEAYSDRDAITAISNLIRFVPDPFLIESAIYSLSASAFEKILGLDASTAAPALLHLAVDNPEPGVMPILVLLGAYPDELIDSEEPGIFSDARGTTPLHIAALRGLPDHAAMLLALGASPDWRNRADQSPLDLVAADDILTKSVFYIYDEYMLDDDQQNELLSHLLEGVDREPIITIVDHISCDRFLTKEFFYSSSPAHISKCLAQGALPDATNKNGETAVHLAAAFGDFNSVQAVLQGVEGFEDRRRLVNLPDALGNTPLHYAARFSQDPWVMPLMIALGADIGAQNAKGRTPLHVAAMRGDSLAHVMVAYLLAAEGTDDRRLLGGLVERKDRDGNTPLHLAASWDRVGLAAAVLLAHGYSPTTPNAQGLTPLMYAAIPSDKKTERGLTPADEQWLVQTLMAKADPEEACQPIGREYQEHAGQTILDFARKNPALSQSDESGRQRSLLADLAEWCAGTR